MPNQPPAGKRPRRAGTALVLFAALLGGLLLGLGCYSQFHMLYSVDCAAYSSILTKPEDRSPLLAATFILAGAIIEIAFMLGLRKLRPQLPAVALTMAPAPLLLCGLAGLFPGFGSAIMFSLGVGWAAARQLLLLPGAEQDLLRRKLQKPLLIGFVLLSLWWVGVGCWMQIEALNVLYLYIHDWGLFLDVARNTLNGKYFITNETGLNFLGNHFMPLSIVLLLPFAALTSTPEPFFLFNALLLYSNAPLIYALARVNKLPRFHALTLATITLLAPSLANLILTQRYGFHENSFFMPLLILFFILQARGMIKSSWVVWGLSLLIKETVPVVWAGVGVVLFLRGERKRGMLMTVLSAVYFLCVTNLVMPYFQGGSEYRMLFMFSHLGNSFGEVALSPVLRPEVFFGTLFSVRTLEFALLLLLPVWMIVFCRPLWLLPCLVPFTFVAIQEGVWLRNIVSQHQADFLMLFYIAAVLAAADIRRRRESGRWEKMLFHPLPGVHGGERLLTPLLCGSLLGALLSFYFFAYGIHGKYSFNAVAMQRSFGPDMELFKQHIPKGAELNASMAPAAHFALRNQLYPNSLNFNYLSNFVLLDLFTEYEDRGLFDQVRGTLLSRNYRVIERVLKDGRMLILLAREGVVKPDRLHVVSDLQYSELGRLLPQKWPDCEVRFTLLSDKVMFFIRPVKPLDCDFEIQVLLFGSDGSVSGEKNLFGDGVTPAFLAAPGSMMIYELPLPAGGLREIKVKLTPRPPIDRKHHKFPISEKKNE
ncbi:MAG: DUF2079 domain-containing protein [Victivallaceae bacterium]